MRFPGIVFSIATFFVAADSAIAARQHELDDCAESDPDRSIAVYTLSALPSKGDLLLSRRSARMYGPAVRCKTDFQDQRT